MEVINPVNEMNIISLKNMVDLALGTPEVGVVNFNILHSLLHAMLSKFELEGLKVIIPNENTENQDVNSKVENLTFSTIPYHGLQERIKVLESQVNNFNSLPSNKDILDSIIKDKDGQSEKESQRSVNELWQSISIKKKVNANEEGIDRLSSMIDSILNEMKQLKSDNDLLKQQLQDFSNMKGIDNKIDGLQNDLANLLSEFNKLKDKVGQYPSPESLKNIVTWENLEKALKGIKDDMEELKKPTERIVVNMATEADQVMLEVNRLIESGKLSPKIEEEEEILFNLKIPLKIPDKETIEGIDYFVVNIPIKNDQDTKSDHVPIVLPMSRPESQISKGPSEACAEMLEKLGQLTVAHDLLDERVVKLEEEMPNKADKKDLENLKIPDDLLKTISQLKSQMDTLVSSKNRDTEALARIRDILSSLQEKMNSVNEMLDKLSNENKDLLTQIEELFGITKDHENRKSDINYVDGLLRAKADKSLLDSKVNFTLFDETTGNLHSLIDDMLKKLLAAEEELRNLLKSLSQDVYGKVDKDDLNALKEWFEKRLRKLAEKLKNIRGGGDYAEDDAAGLRKQLLQHFHCISCDRPVDILPQAMNYSNGLPPTKSLRPQNIYELDALRHVPKNTQETRVVNPKYVSYGNDIIDVYQTPRPCGGSHTTTYPQKKLTRLGNINNSFIEDEMYTKSMKDELDLQGLDGHIYRGRFDRSQTTLVNNSINYVDQITNDKLPPVTTTQRSQTLTPRGAFVTSRPKSAIKGTPRQSSNTSHSRPASARIVLPETDSRPTSPIRNIDQITEQNLTEPEENISVHNRMSNSETVITSENFNLDIINTMEVENQSTDDTVVL